MMRTAAIATLALGAAASVNIHDRSYYEAKFVNWLHEHGVQLKDGADFVHRLAIFADNDDYIFNQNAKNLPYTLGHNEYSMYTHDEFLEMMHLNDPVPAPVLGDAYHTDVDVSGTGATVDWVSKGAVTGVKNQGSCGSCWSFSSTGALEGAYKLKYGSLQSFSEQQLVSCDNLDNGCNGGWMTNTFTWVRNNGGICTESAYPYTSGNGQRGSCRSCSNVSGSRVANIYTVANSESALQSAVNGRPVSVAIDAGSRDFQSYSGGVFTGSCTTSVNHGVLAVGYGTDGRDYWKVKNSWGASWGEGGYIRMQRNTGTSGGKCGITTGASYPTL